MTHAPRRPRWMAAPVAIALTAGFLGATTAPASAAKTTFSSTTDVFFGESSLTVSQGTALTVPGSGTNGPASLYPSQITVSHGAIIEDVNVSLTGITHTFPDDFDVLLVGPGGQQALILSDVGGATPVAGVNLVLDDEQASALPDAGPLVSGAFQPSNFAGSNDTFEAPSPAASGSSALSEFDGTNAAGVWSLWVRDDAAGDTGSIGSWSITFDLATTPYPSTINVTGLPPISDVNVTLDNLTSTFPDDADLLLVGPGGQQATVLSDAGSGFDVTDIDLTFDDEAAAAPPDAAQLVAGTFQPANYSTVADPYPSPAPASSGATLLSAFDGLNPNGAWRLFAVDDGSPDLVTLSGWSLEFTWADISSPSGTMNISGGAATTTTTNVSLSLTAADPAPSSGVAQMRFSNDGVTYSGLQPFAPTAAWTLLGGDGTKTVYAQFQDGDGNLSAPVSDTINLDATGPHSSKTTPKDKAKNVSKTTKIKIKANEALAAGTVSKNSVILKIKGGDKVSCKVSYNASKKQIVLTPKKDLKKGKTYKVTVKTSVKDLVGHAWDEKPTKSGSQALKFSFQT